jgi:N-acetylglucosamine-6-phosphate deacetylase
MEATGLPDGSYQLGGQAVTVMGKKAVITDKPDVIAGSVTNLFACMRNCVLDMGIPLEQAVRAATENPAKAIGIEKEYGRIEEENYANLILTDKELNIMKIIRKGKVIR